ncbi:hypothetical protein D7V32_01110 [Acinetobacter tianfuensis]|uniref:Uncharacterized protein n=1 Tax=Acinetobacter tianfuensis TaxID=2419603 RepID=A0A3A8EJC0_9GAMM|nr:hypothetical protein D7V32_01110 [Acinetobacter tianfuensis]
MKFLHTFGRGVPCLIFDYVTVWTRRCRAASIYAVRAEFGWKFRSFWRDDERFSQAVGFFCTIGAEIIE